MCGIVGVSTKSDGSEAAFVAYQALFALQHRGVEASGIVTSTEDGSMSHIRKPGMVRDVYNEDELRAMNGEAAVGHNRYTTNGHRLAHLQPVLKEEIGFAFAHNGNIPDTDNLEDYLKTRRYRTGQYNDSEMFATALASKLHGGRSIEQALNETFNMVEGGYSCVFSHEGSVAAFRDPQGIRPLEIGTYNGGIVFASETCALDTIGAKHLRSVRPGELVVARRGKLTYSEQFADSEPKLDIFEMIYFARHDSYLYGQRVNEVRRRLGYELAKMHPPQHDKNNSVVVPVPDTSLPIAEGFAELAGLPHEQLIIKNRYIGRTFMQPDQQSRRDNLRLKHTIVSERIKGRNVYIIDDSIVRKNTIPRLVKLARKMKARSVSVLIASPPIRFPDFYGVDTPSQDELAAANETIEEIRQSIDADYLGYLSVSAMVNATTLTADKFNLASFTGEYPVSIGKHVKDIRPPVSNEYMD